MKRRRITLADGRYMIFYTFTDETAAARTPAVEPHAETSEQPLPAERQPETEGA